MGSGVFCVYIPPIFISDLSGVNKRITKHLIGKALWKKKHVGTFTTALFLLRIE